MSYNSQLKLWRLVPSTLASHPDVWACSRMTGPCEVVAASERIARFQAAGAFCLPVAPGSGPGVCPWLENDHVVAELVERAVWLAPGVISPCCGQALAIAAAPESS